MSTKPRVWSEFTVKNKSDELKLKILDLPSNRVDDYIDLFLKHFLTEETFNKIAGVTENEEAMKESAELLAQISKVNIIVCCVDDGSETGGQMIAASGMSLIKRGDETNTNISDFKPKTKEVAKALDIIQSVSKMYDVSKILNLDSYYDGRGIVVYPDYRGLGLAQKFLHIRRKICKEYGVPVTGALLTGFASQKAAERDGWETIFEVSYETLSEKLGIEFIGVPSTCKYMYAKAL